MGRTHKLAIYPDTTSIAYDHFAQKNIEHYTSEYLPGNHRTTFTSSYISYSKHNWWAWHILVRFPNPLASGSWSGSDIHGSWGTWLDIFPPEFRISQFWGRNKIFERLWKPSEQDLVFQWQSCQFVSLSLTQASMTHRSCAWIGNIFPS